MKIKAKRTISALLAALMLVLAVPMTGLFGLAEDGAASEPVLGVVANNPTLKNHMMSVSCGEGYGTKGTVTSKTDANGYHYLEATAGALPAKFVSGGGLFSSGINATKINGWSEEGGFDVSRDTFTLEMSFAQTDKPLELHVRFRIALAAPSGQLARFLGKAEDGTEKWVTQEGVMHQSNYMMTILSVGRDNGNISLLGQQIGCVKTADQHVSVVATYSDSIKGYYLDAYVNGILAANDVIWNSAPKDKTDATQTLSATVDGVTYTRTVTPSTVLKDFHDGTAAQYINDIQFYGGYSNDYTSDKGDFDEVKDESGNVTGYILNRRLAVKNWYCVFGTDVPRIDVNTNASKSTLMLITNGKTPDGYVTNGNLSCKTVPESEILGGEIALPEIDGIWYDAVTHQPISKVSADHLGTGVPAAYTLHDKLLKSYDYEGQTVVASSPSGHFYALNPYTDSKAYCFVSSWTDSSDPANPIVYQKANRTLQLSGFFNPIRTANIGGRAVITVSFSFTPMTEQMPGFTFRFRDGSGAQNNAGHVFATEGSYFKFCGQKILQVTPGETYDVVIVTDATTKTEKTSSTTVNLYINGVHMGKSVRDQYFTVGTGTSYDVNNFQLYSDGSDASSTYQKQLMIDDIRIYAGYDPATTSPVEKLSGASIRLDKNTDTSGLRFSFRIAKARYDELCSKGDVEFGALIVPTDYLTDGKIAALTHAAIGDAKALDMKVTGFSDESDENYYYFNASIVKLLSKNYAREFTAVGYVKVGDTYYYSHTSDSRSVIDVALKYGNSAEYAAADADKKAIADAYRSKVVYLELASGESGVTATVLAKEGYTAPYTVSYTDGTLSLSGAGVSGISTIVLNGEVYTGGWSTVDGAEVETVSAPYTLPAAEETPAE